MPLYPFKFVPRLVEKMWGGRKLQTVLGKQLPAQKPIGESWELYDFPPGVVEGSTDWVSSVIANGHHAGKTLHWLMGEFGQALLGRATPVGLHGQFPLLIKFLDAREDLSVQVHPDEAYAKSDSTAHLKTEAWYVMQHDENARLLKGVIPGTTRDTFRRGIEAGTVENHLAAIPAALGECHYLPSGTVHALGAGILVAEVQTPSDTTFRVYDFNRVDPSTGKVRTLHVEQAMKCINFDSPPAAATGQGADSELVRSPYFVMERISGKTGVAQAAKSGEPAVLIMLKGAAQIRAKDAEPVSCRVGETVLLPAGLKDVSVTPAADSQWLNVTIPARA